MRREEERGVKPLRRVAKADRWLRLAPPTSPSAPGPSGPLDDEGLIEAVLKGDTRRAGELHDRLIPAIEPALYRVMGKRELDHDDLVQATFEQIVLTLVRGRFARGCSLSTWASSVAAHVAFNALRARRRARRVFDSVESAEDAADARLVGDAVRDMSVRDEIRRAQAHLTSMTPDRAMVLVLHDVLGHDLAEIAAILRISMAAAQSRLVRARHEFQKRVRAEDASQEGPPRGDAPRDGGHRIG
jgi:RNA polymerase sigma-70 factor (ECF subfamily)